VIIRRINRLPRVQEVFEPAVASAAMLAMILLLAAKCSPSSKPSGAAALSERVQEQKTEMPKPGVEHQRLGYFVGQWHLEGEVKPVVGPAGKDTEDDDCQWLGRFFVVCHSSETF
jgi:hypothetical protein